MTKYIDADALEQMIVNSVTKITGEVTPDGLSALVRRQNQILDMIDNMPAEDVEPVRKWIPCSERLPEAGKTVLVWYEYFRYGEYNRLYQTCGVGYQFKGVWSMSGSCVKCIAWMPLPEPPKMDGGSEE